MSKTVMKETLTDEGKRLICIQTCACVFTLAAVSARNKSVTALTTASLYAPACATGMAAILATSAMKGGSRTQAPSHMLWIAEESENKRATPVHALYSTVVATVDGT
eukprot:1078640-Pelagomonas_calceolata.AAC.2